MKRLLSGASVSSTDSADAEFYSLCGSWADDPALEHIEDIIAESRQSNVTRQLGEVPLLTIKKWKVNTKGARFAQK